MILTQSRKGWATRLDRGWEPYPRTVKDVSGQNVKHVLGLDTNPAWVGCPPSPLRDGTGEAPLSPKDVEKDGHPGVATHDGAQRIPRTLLRDRANYQQVQLKKDAGLSRLGSRITLEFGPIHLGDDVKDWERLIAENEGTEFQKRFCDLYALRGILSNSVWSKSFVVDDEWGSAIRLSPDGTRLLQNGDIRECCGSEAAMAVLLFLRFAQQHLFLDALSTNVEKIRELVEQKLFSGEVKLPWLFEHLLYDKVFELGLDRRDARLSPEETVVLLDSTPIGVFQLGQYVAGPFGLLRSSQARNFPPMRDVVIGHCSDPNCAALHLSQLSSGESRLSEAIPRFSKLVEKLDGERREWNRAFLELSLPPGHYYDDYSLVSIVWFLGNAFSTNELRSVAAHLLNSRGKAIRSRLPNNDSWRRLFAAPASDITARLAKPELLQLILLASDDEVIASLDYLIERREIKIPPSEVRGPVTAPVLRTWTGATLNCSSLGVRIIGRMPALSLARLRRLVLELYEGKDDQKQLSWLLRNQPGDSLGEKVDNLINAEPAGDVLRNVAFINEDKLRETLQRTHCSHFAIPNDSDGEKRLISRILWKLGFPQFSYPSSLATLYERLDSLRRAAQPQPMLPDEKWREHVRSIGANFFVSLEEILDLSLPFITWLLLSDHLEEAHRYNSERAKLFTRAQISGLLSTDKGPIEYAADQRNTLFPLISGFSALRQQIRSLLDRGSAEFLKPKILMGHYSHTSTLQVFPYRHRHFIFDMSSAELDRSMDLIDRVFRALNASDAMRVRNCLDHHTEEFPSGSQLEACCNMIESTVAELENAGFVPLVYGHIKTTTDSYGRTVVLSSDYAGRTVEWRRSAALTSLRTLPHSRAPQILVSSIRLGETAEILRFSIEECSEFHTMWLHYPKRRAPSDREIAEAEAEAAPAAPH
jgi:hypothetical protein